VHEGRAGTGGGVDGNQKAVQFAGGGALLGVLGPAPLHDDEENGGESRSARGQRIRNFGGESVLDERHEDGLVDALKWRVTKCQFPEDDAKSVHVGEGVGRYSVKQLRR
jgi:hypothetical protein